MTFTSSQPFYIGKSIYIVPVVIDETEGTTRPRCPANGWSAQYHTDGQTVALIATQTAASYLSKRSYARRIGDVERGPERLHEQLEALGYSNTACELSDARRPEPAPVVYEAPVCAECFVELSSADVAAGRTLCTDCTIMDETPY